MIDGDPNASNAATEASNDTAEARPSLAERLMNADPANAAAIRAGATRAMGPSNSWRPQIAPPSPGLDNALKEARNYIRLRYAVFLISVLALLVLTLIGAATFISEMRDSRDWEKLALSGGLGGVALVLLVVLQYRPANGFRLAAVQWAQLEAARRSLNHSVELWDEFLTHREATGELNSMDVSAAVSSLAAAARVFGEAEPRVSTQSQSRDGAKSPIPTPSAPDPRRYS